MTIGRQMPICRKKRKSELNSSVLSTSIYFEKKCPKRPPYRRRAKHGTMLEEKVEGWEGISPKWASLQRIMIIMAHISPGVQSSPNPGDQNKTNVFID
jgi:hypothetical protein